MILANRIRNIQTYIATYIADLLYFKNNDSYIPTKEFLPERPTYDPNANHTKKLIYTLRVNEGLRNNLSLNGRNYRWLDEIIDEEKERIEKELLSDNFSNTQNHNY